MRITRLELAGFKSFADRTVFRFGSGINCVVGPNGCGKSNVVDALRWVIGEQSARSLRGGEMLDVIFAGSAERKPVGYAEVGLTLSAEGGEPFPGEFARFTEVQVARRLYRSGASEYLINQARCRRKDIVDLFMDSGVGNNLYSFIEQGRIDKIVSASPEDRRSLIDEAAGITRYLKRRAEAISKLEATGGQLDRAADVAEEMERRLRTLERQVVKAARFRRLRGLMRQGEIFLALVKFADLQSGRGDHDARLERLRGELDALENAVVTDHDDLAVREGEVEVATSSAEAAREALTEVDARQREQLAAQGLHEQRTSELERQVQQAATELADDEARVGRARASLDTASRELLEVADALEVAGAHARVAEGRLAELESVGQDLRDASRQAEVVAADVSGRRAAAAARAQALEARAAELPERIARVATRLDEARQEQVIVSKRGAVAEEVLAERATRIATLDARKAGLVTQVDDAVRADVHARDAVRAAEIELDAAQRALDEAVQQAETTAGQADEEVAARVGRVQQQEENALRDAERADAKALAEAEAAERTAVEQADRRARRWSDEARRQRDLELASWRRQVEADFEQQDATHEAALDQAVADGAAAVDAVEARGREAMATAVGEARARRDAAEARLAEARQALTDAEARLAVAVRRKRELEGRQAALEAELRAEGDREAGARAVAEVLPDAPRLVDVLDLPDDARDWAVPWLSEHLLLPVTDAAGVVRAAQAAASAGPARVLVADGRPELAALTADVAVVDSLQAALGHHAAHGGAAVVRGSGERVARDGVVHLGGAAAADEALARRAGLAEVREALQAQVAEVDALERAITSARARVEGAAIGVRKATEQVDAVEHEARTRLEGEVAVARAAADAAVRTLREARASWRAEARPALEARIAERVTRTQRADGTLRAEAEAVLATLRDEAEVRMRGRREASEAGRATRRADADARIEAAREAAWEQVRATTADVRVRRERLREVMEDHRRGLDKARQRAERTADALRKAQDAVTAADRERGEQDVVVARVTAERDAAREQLSVLVARQAALEEEREGLAVSMDDVTRRLAEASTLLHGLEAEAREVGEALDAARARLAEHQVRIDEARSVRDTHATKVSELTARRAGLEATRVAAGREVESTDERRASVRHRIAELEQLLDDARQARQQTSAMLDVLGTERQEAVARADAARERLQAVRTARDEVARRVREAESTLGTLRQAVLSAEQIQHQTSMEVSALRERMEERYQLDLDTTLDQLLDEHELVVTTSDEARAGLEVAGKVVEPVPDLRLHPPMLEDEERIRAVVGDVEALREELARLGEVNLTALEEYEELKARFEDLDAQRHDLETSVSSIRTAIAKMNKECRERFRETFDQVNAAFTRAYPELVGGGESRLALTDEEDLLATGVEIFVRPPGKRMQNLGLLSGGEKAMTAIALLLALFEVKPSPFCVLDEVDAPLDEANGARFNDMIKQMGAMTQFIVITHSRTTMQCADTLYGITMPTPGCSSLVSVKLDDASTVPPGLT